MNPKEFVRRNYKKFCSLVGNEFIASEFVLLLILKLLEEFKIHSILELGAGIGTIPDTVLIYSRKRNQPLTYSATESNTFCRIALSRNVANYEHLKLYRSLEELPAGERFDLIIIDGKDDLYRLPNYCKPDSIILIEGDRFDQTETILSIFPKSSYVNVTTLARKKKYAPGEKDIYQGGARLIFLNPNLKKKIFWLEQKLHTHFMRYFRIYKN